METTNSETAQAWLTEKKPVISGFFVMPALNRPTHHIFEITASDTVRWRGGQASSS